MTLAIAAALASPAHALDLVDVWRAAATHDADFAAARAAHAAGIARRTQAGTLWRPGLTLEAGAGLATNDTAARGAQFSAPGFGQTAGVAFDTSINNGTSSRIVLALRQPLLSREREVQQRQLELAAEIAEVQWQDAQQALMRRAAERYFDTVLADEQLRVLERQQAAVDRARTEAQDRFRIGDRPVTDIHEASARAAGLTAQRLAAQTELALKRAALADLSGLAVEAARMPLPRPARSSATPSGPLESWLDEAARGNPGLRLAELQVRSAEQDARKTSAALSPTVDVVAQIGRERLSGNGDFGHASNTASNRAIGVQMSVPLYTGGLRSARQTEALALIDKAGAELESMRRQAALQTRGAWLELSVGLGRSEALEAALTASRARLDATRVGLRAGDRTTLDLLNAENDAAAAELALMQARAHLLLDELRLAALAGRLDEARLQHVNAALQPLP
ncbi:MAG: TolC family outer membrane protein [Caldimonas sp.]